MRNTHISTFLDLPSETLCQIIPFLSKHDLSVCVRVSRAWYYAFMDSLWNTVELRDTNLFGADRPIFRRIMSLYGPYLANGGEAATATQSPFLRNIGRIRDMKVQYSPFLNLFWDQSPLFLEAIPLKDLTVSFEEYRLPQQTGFVSGRQFPTDKEILLQILRRSTRLSTFSFVAGTLTNKFELQDQACFLASFPPTMERLDMKSGWFYYPPNTVADKEQNTKAVDLFLELKKGGSFENLSTLWIASVSVNPALLATLVERSPKLEELNLDGFEGNWDDPELAEIVSKVSSKGWKTLGFKDLSDKIGPLTVAAILLNSATLENLRLTTCKAFDSKSIQKLLSSAPNLKRFDCIMSVAHCDLGPYSLMATDVVEPSEDWVCLGLESFKCYIGGVPRPDITITKNGRPLSGIYNSGARYSMAESSTVQRRVLARLGRLTSLREITLGKDAFSYKMRGYQGWEKEEMESHSRSVDKIEFQHQCLTLSLQDGLDELSDLKCLRRLTLENMSLAIGEAEQTWMKENWPKYGEESKDTFWTSRGHSFGFTEPGHDWW